MSNHRYKRERILILGASYPCISKTYEEVNCVGGVLESGFSMVRLYPVSIRALDDSKKFRAWQWIEADIARDPTDPRPESYRIAEESIILGDRIDHSKHDERRHILEHSPHFVASCKELAERTDRDRTSFGIIKPADVIAWGIEAKDDEECERWHRKCSALIGQPTLDGSVPNVPDYVPFAFTVTYKCDWECPTHKQRIHNWDIHQLWRRLRGKEGWRAQIEAEMRERLARKDRDVFLYVGNFKSTPKTFGVMGVLALRSGHQKLMF